MEDLNGRNKQSGSLPTGPPPTGRQAVPTEGGAGRGLECEYFRLRVKVLIPGTAILS
jgi:hypothetical protein